MYMLPTLYVMFFRAFRQDAPMRDGMINDPYLTRASTQHGPQSQAMHARKLAEEQAGAPARQPRKHDARWFSPMRGLRGSCIGFSAL